MQREQLKSSLKIGVKNLTKAGLGLGILRFMSWFPLPVVHGLGFGLGLLMYWLPNGPKHVAARNLEACFPEMKAAERQRLLRKNMIETAKTFTEMGAMWLWPVSKLEPLIRDVKGHADATALYDRGKGVVALTPHIGQWEFLGMYAVRFVTMTSLYRPSKMKELDDFLLKARTRTGNKLAPTTATGVKSLFQELHQGNVIGILPDQDPGGAGVFAPFFGIEANTMTLVAKMAAKFDSEIIIAYAERLSWGRGYVIHIKTVDRDALTDKDKIKATTALNAAIEGCVRELPTQYQWIYKRFKRRPSGNKKSFY